MFRTIQPGDRAASQGLLDDMHEMRDRIVVGEWGWVIPGAAPGYERDRFDTDETVYCLVLDDHGRVKASARLNPTTQPHMMSELFADYCDLQPWPAGEDVWECSRFVIDTVSVTSRLEEFVLRCHLGIGLTTWCYDHNVRQLSWLTHQKFYNHLSVLFPTQPLGRPVRQGDGWAWIAAVSEIGLDSLDCQIERLRRAPEIVGALIAGKAPGEEGQAA